MRSGLRATVGEGVQLADIELEAFEVGLGSSIYLRLDAPGRDVRILADGGVGRGFAEDHVLGKLEGVFRAEAGDRRIDLVVGTHYDEDHLRGLVPVLRSGIAIGEVWLPPIVDDTRTLAADARSRGDDLLGARFERDPEAVLRYVGRKLEEIAELRELEAALGEGNGDRVRTASIEDVLQLGRGALRSHLQAHLLPADDACGCEHVDAADVDTDVSVSAIAGVSPYDLQPPFPGWLYGYSDPFEFDDLVRMAARMRGAPRSLAALLSLRHVKTGAAKDAINALALDDVIRAAQFARASIRYRTIDRGRPQHFRWDPASGRFLPGRPRTPAEPGLVLLGPSEGLARKHANRLPVLNAATLALVSRVPVKSISPSNQLSYVVGVVHREQGVLLCGDSGFSDFMIGRSRVEPLLLDELRLLDVVQVAHHAGLNQWFYPVLVEAWIGRVRPPAKLLVSHGADDPVRPTPEFERFAQETSTGDGTRRILFTSRPLPGRVGGFAGEVHDAIDFPPGTDAGDIRLECTGGTWRVVRHAVQV